MKIGVFDSGIGGKSVAKAVENALPEHEIMYVQDGKNLPYGDKSIEQLKKIVLPILKEMEAAGCGVIVIACNTVTTNIIEFLRSELKIPLVGIEPMVKTASELTKTRFVAVCATPATLNSKRYAYLKDTYGQGITFLEPDCSGWAAMIEKNAMEERHLQDTIESVLNQNADVIVMGCTHYHWIAEDVEKIAAGRATVLQPEQPVIMQLKRVLEQLS